MTARFARFFIVVNARTGPSRDPARHASLDEAKREAERIAARDPGAKVYVLEARGYAVKRETDWHEAGPAVGMALASRRPDADDDDEIPF